MKQQSKITKMLVNTVKSLVLPVVVYLVFLLMADGRFGSFIQMKNILRQTVSPMLIAMGMSLLMNMGMWDFSVGAVIYAAAIFGANVAQATGTGLVGMVVIALLVAFVLETISGICYVAFKVPCLVLSVGLAMIYESIPVIVFSSQSGAAVIPRSLGTLSQAPYIYCVFIIMFILFYIVYHYSTFGQNVQAIGVDIKIAHNAGINIMKLKFIAFLFSAIFLGLTGVLLVSTNLTLNPAAGLSSVVIIFDSMMGVFIAEFLRKYCGYTFGLLIGVFTMKMLATGLVAMGMSSTVRSISTGFFLMVILCISSNQGRLEKWKSRKRIGEEAEKEYRKQYKAADKA